MKYAAALALTLLVPSAALGADEDQPTARMFMAVDGPGDGEGAFGAMLTMYGFAPHFEVSYIRGIGERFALDVTGTYGLLGAIGLNELQLGGRYRLSSAGPASVGVRVAASGLYIAALDTSAAGIVAHGAAIISVGTETLRFTTTADLPLVIAFDGPPSVGWLEAGIGLEIGAVTGANVALRAKAWIPIELDGTIIPVLSFGGSI